MNTGQALRLFEEYLRGVGCKESYRKSVIYYVRQFEAFARARGKAGVQDQTAEDVKNYVGYLQTEARSRRGKRFTGRTVNVVIAALRRWFRFLMAQDLVMVNPLEDLVNVKESENPRGVFTVEEMCCLLDNIDIKKENGPRDRALFELLYSSGLRVGEAIALELEDLDLNERVLLIKEGKGGRDRFVPFSEMAAYFLRKYIKGSRKRQARILRQEKRRALFLSMDGPMSYTRIRLIFREALDRAGIKRDNVSLHSIRHSTATHLLEAGADVRYVQELLGHENIKTTVKYTHLLPENLRRAYKSGHPRENQYYEEVDETYLAEIARLEEDIAKGRAWREKYRAHSTRGP